jgi:hypothetical protein
MLTVVAGWKTPGFRRIIAAMKKPKAKSVRLSTEQWELVGQFNDYSFEYPKPDFDAIAKKVLGPNPFPNTATGRAFRREAKSLFDLERRP